MAVAKGQIQSDKSYKYTCGHCSGHGQFLDSTTGLWHDCTHCYNLNYDALLEAFITARGERYYAILKALLRIEGKAICDRIDTIRSQSENGGVSLKNVIDVFMEFGWPRNRFKPFVEWLEETRTIRTGTYWDIKDSRKPIKYYFKLAGYPNPAAQE